MLKSKQVPQFIPCPVCGKPVEVSPIILEFADAIIGPNYCLACDNVVAMIELDEDVFVVMIPDSRQMEEIARALADIEEQIRREIQEQSRQKQARWN